MTLRTRNRIIKIFALFSTLCFLGVIATIIVKSLNGTLANTLGSSLFSFKNFSFFKPNEKSVIYTLIFLQFFIPVAAFFLLFSFEKTQSTLIILFCVVLFGFQFELSRFIIGVFDLKRTFSQFYLLLGKYSLLGRLLCLFSFFYIAIESKDSQKLNIEMDLTAIFTVSIFVTLCIPLNTSVSTKTFGIECGFLNVLVALFAVVSLLTILTFIITYRDTENKSIIKILISYLFTATGIHLMECSDILCITTTGAVLLITGTRLYMKALHKMYLWE